MIVDPRPNVGEAVRDDRAGADTACLGGDDPAGSLKNLQMLHERRQRHVVRRGQLADTGGTLPQSAKDRPPDRISQGLERRIQGFGLLSHMAQYV